MQEALGIKSLKKLGLTEKEAKIYAALTEIGDCTAEQLSKITGIHRRSVYDALNALMRNGLIVTSFLRDKKVFATTGVHVFLSWIEENKEYAADFLHIQAEKRKITLPAPQVKVFYGKNGIKAILADVIKEGKLFYNYGGAGYIPKFLENYYPQWASRIQRAKIPSIAIFTDMPGVREMAKKQPIYNVRFISKKFFSYAVWWLYGNKMVILFWKEDPLAIVIEGEEFAKTYRNFFNIMWRHARK